MTIEKASRSALGIGAAMMLGTGLAGAIPTVGTRAPQLALSTVSGKPFHLSSIEGRQPVLLNFFTTW